jgi:hypothetical protein
VRVLAPQIPHSPGEGAVDQLQQAPVAAAAVVVDDAVAHPLAQQPLALSLQQHTPLSKNINKKSFIVFPTLYCMCQSERNEISKADSSISRTRQKPSRKRLLALIPFKGDP